MKTIKTFLIRMLCSRMGWLLKLAISSIVSGITLGLAKLGIAVDAQMQVEIAAAAGSLTFIALQSALIKLQLNDSEAIQESLAKVFPDIARDRRNGPKDQAKIEAIIARLNLAEYDDNGDRIPRAIPIDEPKP